MFQDLKSLNFGIYLSNPIGFNSFGLFEWEWYSFEWRNVGIAIWFITTFILEISLLFSTTNAI